MSKDSSSDKQRNVSVLGFSEIEEQEEFDFAKTSETPTESNKSEKDNELKPLRKTQGLAFQKYLEETGIPEAFQLIYAELKTKNIRPENFYIYAAARLRQIGREFNKDREKLNK